MKETIGNTTTLDEPLLPNDYFTRLEEILGRSTCRILSHWLFNTGCRKGELLGLEWRRVNMKARLILLEGTHTKAGKRRSVPINNTAHSALMRRLKFRAQHCPQTPWVFCHPDGTQVKNIHARGGFRTACRRAGIENFRVHDLRHTCAAWLVTAGVPLAEVRDLLDHHTIGMTERYAHLAPENIRQAVAQLDAVSRSGHLMEIISNG